MGGDADACGPVGPRKLSQGTVARVVDLQGKDSKFLNNKPCVVQRYISSSGRYEVRVADELKGLRPENLDPFQLQQEMIITDLRTDAARHLNGERCLVRKFNQGTDRLEVTVISTGEIKALKLE